MKLLTQPQRCLHNIVGYRNLPSRTAEFSAEFLLDYLSVLVTAERIRTGELENKTDAER